MRTLFFTCVFALLFGGLACAESLRIVTLHYPPYEYREDGRIKGIATELVREAFHRMNVEITIELLPWSEALDAVRTGKADAIYTAFKTKERKQFLTYPENMLVGQMTALFVLESANITYAGDLNALRDKTFSVVRKISYGDKFDAAVAAGKLKNFHISMNGEESVDAFLSGKADILVSNELEARTILKKRNALHLVKMLEPPLQQVPSYLAFSKASGKAHLADEFSDALDEMKRDGTYDTLLSNNL